MSRQPVFGVAMLADLVKSHADAEGTDEQSSLRDLLTDLRHAAANMGFDFEFAVEGSAEVFSEEVMENEEGRA